MSLVDHTLHAIAVASVRVLSPHDAYRLVLRVGALFPQHGSSVEVRKAAQRLRRGTCLTRAMTIAARTPRSEVVIAVGAPRDFSAHAWVELDGVPILPSDAVDGEIVRLART